MDRPQLTGILSDPELLDELTSKGIGNGTVTATARALGLAPAAEDLPLGAFGVVLQEGPPPALNLPGPAGLMEAVVIPFGRPALLVRNDTFEVPESDVWKARLYPTKSKIERAIRSVGRIDLRDHDSLPWVGTAWMVADNVAVTNRHVANEFARKAGRQYSFRKNLEGVPIRAYVDYKHEHKVIARIEVVIDKIIFIAEDRDDAPDIAFLHLKPTDEVHQLPPPIYLSSKDVATGQYVVAIGYPASDSRNDPSDVERIFGNTYEVKRVAPGAITNMGDGFFFNHDCSTLAGNSGSAIVDIETGAALGLHFAGVPRIANYAVKASTIAKEMARLKIKAPTQPAPDGLDEEELLLEAAQPQVSDYTDRKGYVPDFLGRQKSVRVPLPKLSPQMAASAATLNVPGAGADDLELKYTHFSIVMNAERKMAYFTASNIDGNKLRRIPRSRDHWVFDPRIARDEQAGPDVYKNNDLDLGHQVRRLDPVWGSDAEALKANNDTFHFTNACPQHRDLNQKTWNDLEDYVLGHAENERLKVLVFTGPVLADNDPRYRTVRLPRQFWKIVVMVRADTRRLSATAYLLSQGNLISDLEGFVFGEFKTFQVPVKRVEDLTGLDFGPLRKFDPLRQIEGLDVRIINTVEDIVI